jgi:hypothetical protein
VIPLSSSVLPKRYLFRFCFLEVRNVGWTQLQQAYQEAQQRLDAVKARRASRDVSPLKLMQEIAGLQREMDALLREHPQLVG